MNEQIRAEYSQGVCGDGAAILKDGQPMTINEIVAELNQAAHARYSTDGTQESCKHGIRYPHECRDCQDEPLSEGDVAIYAHECLAEILDPHINRGDGNPDRFLPDSVTESVQMLLEFRLAYARYAGSEKKNRTQLPEGTTRVRNAATGEIKPVGYAGGGAPAQPQVPEVLEGLGGVLYYSTSGHNRACAQAIGANGQGGYAVLIMGSPDEAADKARDILRELEKSGYYMRHAEFVPNDNNAGYYGNPVSIVTASQEQENNNG